MTGLTPAGALPLQAARSVAKLLFREFGSLEVIEFLTPDFWILPQKSNFATEPFEKRVPPRSAAISEGRALTPCLGALQCPGVADFLRHHAGTRGA